jgi:hypothetical protein
VLPVILNFILFQVAWFLTVFSASVGTPLYGPVFTLIWVICHLNFWVKKPVSEINLLFFAATIGYLFDSAQVLLGYINFPNQAALGGPSPVWMIALWINLAATLNLSMKWLRGKLFLAAITGAIAGPAAYYAGNLLGAIELYGTGSIIALSIQWMMAMPLLVWYSQRINHHDSRDVPMVPRKEGQ